MLTVLSLRQAPSKQNRHKVLTYSNFIAYTSFLPDSNNYKNSPDRRNPVEKELTLHYREFFPRLQQHVPLRYFRIVRYYGFYSNKGNLPEEYFGRNESEIEETGLHQEESGYENPYFCVSVADE
jgi:hypothetical protein